MDLAWLCGVVEGFQRKEDAVQAGKEKYKDQNEACACFEYQLTFVMCWQEGLLLVKLPHLDLHRVALMAAWVLASHVNEDTQPLLIPIFNTPLFAMY